MVTALDASMYVITTNPSTSSSRILFLVEDPPDRARPLELVLHRKLVARRHLPGGASSVTKVSNPPQAGSLYTWDWTSRSIYLVNFRYVAPETAYLGSLGKEYFHEFRTDSRPISCSGLSITRRI
jgi:hypothetical protein